MPGFPSIESIRSRARSPATAAALEGLLGAVAVGVLAGLAAAHMRLHAGLPGHKALLWMAPIIAARLVFPSAAGATAGAVSAALAALAAGGNLAGGATGLPAVGLAGMLLDGAIGLAERRRLSAAWMVPLVGLAGMAANGVMLAKRLTAPLLNSHEALGLGGIGGRLASYAAFGLAAGLLGAAVGHLVRRRRGHGTHSAAASS
jgi:hypothetical protein